MKIILMVLGLLLSIPSLSFANGTEADVQSVKTKMVHKDCHEGNHSVSDLKWQEKMKERDSQLLTWVNKYTPGKRQEWEQVITERKNLHEKWMSPEYAAKREQWKKMRIEKMEALKKAFEEGKISKEEFMAKVHHGKKMGAWKTYHELKTAVETKNDQKVKELLDQMLIHYKMHNEKMKSMFQASGNQ